MQLRVAEAVNDDSPLCLSYPTFNMLEKLVIYPSYSQRIWMLSCFGVDFNGFEEKNIPMVTNNIAFENELSKLLDDESFSSIKNIFMKLLQSQ